MHNLDPKSFNLLDRARQYMVMQFALCLESVYGATARKFGKDVKKFCAQSDLRYRW